MRSAFSTNYHSHSHFCDGVGTPEEQVQGALQAGLRAFGFSSHCPMPFDNRWSMKAGRLDDYLRETASLKEKYAGSIELYTGLEVDYIPNRVGPSTYRDRLDYTVGSVHYVGLDDGRRPWEIDGSQTVFMDGLTEVHQGDIETVIRLYYGLIREMVAHDPPDIVGHLDKIKIQNAGHALFDPSADWYRSEVIATLDAVASAGCMVEVNTRGLYKKALTTYPGPEWLPTMRERNIPVVLNSDSHHPSEISAGFRQAGAFLREAGYNTVRVLLDGHWQDSPIDLP
ncbi:histidinol-phosphatase [Larkinella soli]|uniref:histidinol-phosphatase n=1 Tax=Larkinella soli TaxID=1770527 RepID=UPI0013E2E24C|nr:histidinol-phosphatase [Larkinella soli]